MFANCDSDWNVANLTDREIYAAIRYLELEPTDTEEWNVDDQNKHNGVVICVCLYISMLFCLAFLWFYWQ